jgi:hypothetical protein
MSDLRMGATILKDFIDLQNQKRERAEQSKREAKAVAEAAAQKVKIARHSYEWSFELCIGQVSIF